MSSIEKVPPGERKKTVYGAILLAWQNIALGLENTGLAQGGADSANFWKRAFARVEVEIPLHPSERVRDAMKRRFAQNAADWINFGVLR